jgi:hypothetical protein
MTQTFVVEVDPKLEQRLENIEQKLDLLLGKQDGRNPEDDAYYTAPEFLLKFRCGRSKLKQLVDAGAVERNGKFGRNPRYRWLRREEMP